MNVICTRNIRLPMQLIMKKSRKTFSNALKLKVDVNTVIYQEKYEEICVANTMSSYKTVFIKKPCNIKKKEKKRYYLNSMQTRLRPLITSVKGKFT